MFLIVCQDVGLMAILYTVKKVLQLIQIIVPILLIVVTGINFTKLVMNPDDKKGLKKVLNSFIAAIIVFMIPVIVNATFALLDDTTKLSDCWNNATPVIETSGGTTYQEEGERKGLFTDPSEYIKGSPKPSASPSTSKETSPATTTGESTPTAVGDKTGSGNTQKEKTIFLGDSRTVQMYAYLNNNWQGANYSSGGIHEVGNDIYIAEGSMGLNWLKSTGVPEAKKYFTNNSAIVILMGVNDLRNVDNYIKYINDNATAWKQNGSSLYFVSVNPCDGSYEKLNSQIETFNAKMKSNLSSTVGYIDTYTELKRKGFKTTDGLHYKKETYELIYTYVKSRI